MDKEVKKILCSLENSLDALTLPCPGAFSDSGPGTALQSCLQDRGDSVYIRIWL